MVPFCNQTSTFCFVLCVTLSHSWTMQIISSPRIPFHVPKRSMQKQGVCFYDIAIFLWTDSHWFGISLRLLCRSARSTYLQPMQLLVARLLKDFRWMPLHMHSPNHRNYPWGLCNWFEIAPKPHYCSPFMNSFKCHRRMLCNDRAPVARYRRCCSESAYSAPIVKPKNSRPACHMWLRNQIKKARYIQPELRSAAIARR